MTHLTKTIKRTVVLEDHDFRKTGFIARIEIAPEGIYLCRPRQPKKSALLLPWKAAYMKAGDLRGAQLRAEKAAKRKARKIARGKL